MRMWNVNPKKMCSMHLLGEHTEIHMFVGSIRKGISMKGYIDKGYLEVHNLRKRHDELVKEMLERGYKHYSPLPLFKVWKAGHIDVGLSEITLAERCSICEFISLI